jgi:RecB family exonuclease
MNHYSHSSLDIARTCMLRYKYKYIDKLKIKIEDKSAADFGSVMHEIAENYKGSGREELLKLYRERVPSKYQLTDFYKAKIPVALKNIHEFWKVVLSSDLVESIKHEEDLSIDFLKDIKLVGKIDIVIKTKDGRYRIVDYKTSKSRQYADHTNQLAMYMYLLNKSQDIPYDKMDCEICYLALDAMTKKQEPVKNEGYENISKVYKLEESDVTCLISEIEMIHKRIQKSIAKGEWSHNPTWFNCTYCDYNTICDKKFGTED